MRSFNVFLVIKSLSSLSLRMRGADFKLSSPSIKISSSARLDSAYALGMSIADSKMPTINMVFEVKLFCAKVARRENLLHALRKRKKQRCNIVRLMFIMVKHGNETGRENQDNSIKKLLYKYTLYQ